jgi:hypothetical protein
VTPRVTMMSAHAIHRIRARFTVCLAVARCLERRMVAAPGRSS